MDLFAISVTASIFVKGKRYDLNCIGSVEAENKDEAIGKADRILEAHYPRSSGWFNHHKVVSSANFIVSPDKVAAYDHTTLGAA